MLTRDEIAQQALSLPADDRAFLADMLEQSLQESESSPQEMTAFWTAELDRRFAAHERDPSRAVDGETALAEMSAHLEAHRLGKSK